MGPADFEHRLTRELQMLPTPRAPGTLLPRVMAAVQAWALRPWYQRAWFTWPPARRMLCAVSPLLRLAPRSTGTSEATLSSSSARYGWPAPRSLMVHCWWSAARSPMPPSEAVAVPFTAPGATGAAPVATADLVYFPKAWFGTAWRLAPST